ncbi:hypothetical protein ASD04_00805 [Devosia sp. Root436]|uniref:hypothetical protein n=1 Tax=Devosia sp. Root436 TaxID=1736537 RepID=UPI0006FD9D48|nr:hypothetical protein [Devosia sp. Root436]KQX42541.1 hypothetical protein ASD04_00805 [Devosia sp. Root436]
MSSDSSSFEVTGCEVRYFGPHKTISGRVTGVVRVLIEERFMGNVSRYPLDLKVKADVGSVSADEVRTALLTHAAHQVNRLKARHGDKLPVAAE